MKSLPLALVLFLSAFSLESQAAEPKAYCELTHSKPGSSLIKMPMAESQRGDNTFFHAAVDGYKVVVSTKAGLKSAMILIVDAATGETRSSASGGISQDAFALLESYYSVNSEILIVTCRLMPVSTAAE
jgi:hypothetical protein